MAVHKNPGGQMTRDRYAELTRILEERRREIMDQVQEKIRDARTESPNSPTQGLMRPKARGGYSGRDRVRVDQMKASAAQNRGSASRSRKAPSVPAECGRNLGRRLRALPFAVGAGLRRGQETVQRREGDGTLRRVPLCGHAGINVRLAPGLSHRGRTGRRRPAFGAPAPPFSAYHHSNVLVKGEDRR
jgi:hypothetical protein